MSVIYPLPKTVSDERHSTVQYPVEVPGPIDNAMARPIAFKSGGQSYFAYRQGKEPDFNEKTATDVAAEFAIVKESRADEGMATEPAVLNKHGELVDQYQQAVGYSVIPNDELKDK